MDYIGNDFWPISGILKKGGGHLNPIYKSEGGGGGGGLVNRGGGQLHYCYIQDVRSCPHPF